MALDFIALRVVIVKEGILVFSSVFGIYNAFKARRKDVFKDDLAHNCLLVHILFNQLNEELVNLGLKFGWNVH